jgi:hypothetical protein
MIWFIICSVVIYLGVILWIVYHLCAAPVMEEIEELKNEGESDYGIYK